MIFAYTASRITASYLTNARFSVFCNNIKWWWIQQHIVTRGKYQQLYSSSFCTTPRKNQGGSSKKKLSGSSLKWTQRHEKDPYVKKARLLGSPSRAIFKLEEIDSMVEKYMQQQIKRKRGSVADLGNLKQTKLFYNPNAVVLDLGAAPGGWSKYVAERLGSDGLLIAIDLLPLDDRTVTSIEKSQSSPSFHFLQGDFTSESVKMNILDMLKAHDCKRVEYVISDMAANFTGDSMTDALRTMQLCEDALMLAVGSSCFDERSTKDEDDGILMRGGTFLCKYFACGQQHEQDLKNAVKRNFELSTVLKPKASRKESAELYLFATGFLGGKEK
jgi:23S rRNA U2552 (ribose-2'-O)-methylase RlmE/FtsJ